MIDISTIQPGEEYLRRSTLNYFLENPDELQNQTHFIKLLICPKRAKFDYGVRDGSHRLMANYLLVNHELDLNTDEEIDPDDLRDLYKIRRSGVHSWEDLKSRFVSDEEYEAHGQDIMNGRD